MMRVNWALVSLAAAACVAFAAVIWRGGGGGGTLQPPQVAGTQPTTRTVLVAVGAQLPPPSRAAYQRALARSPEALDALLDAHAARLFPAAGDSKTDPTSNADAFPSFRTRLSTSNGETL